MKRREWLFAAVGAVLLSAAALLISKSRGPLRDELLAAGNCRVPLRILGPPQESRDAVILLHGLSANRRIMQPLGQRLAAAGLRVYLADLPGHGDNTEPFSLGRAEQCAAATVESLVRRGEIALEHTVLVGHSMGGAIAVRLADRFPAAATIAISPAPTSPPRRMPSNLLILSAQFDMARLKEAGGELLRAAGGERAQPEDFHQRRAVKFQVVPRSTHTSLLFDQRVADLSTEWARSALNLPPPGTAAPSLAVTGGALGLAGLLLLFPLTATGLATVLRAAGSETPRPHPAAGRLLVGSAAAALLAVGVLNFWVPLRALRLLAGDYLASALLLAGAALLVLLGKEARASFDVNWRAVSLACAQGAVTVLAFGAWLNWQLTDAWMNVARWLRFFPAVVASLPYFFAEEVAVGPPGAGRDWQRMGTFLALRLTLWLAMIFALFAFGSGQILILLLAVYLAVVSVLQRWGADAVRRRTGSATAAAVFGAILAGWFLAAVFPLR